MEDNKSLMGELVGKTILVKTHWGLGTKDLSLTVGEYKGVLLDFDGKFMKLQYEIKAFSKGKTVTTSDIILLNSAYIVSVNEYKEKPE